jgi:hypothetical protein
LTLSHARLSATASSATWGATIASTISRVSVERLISVSATLMVTSLVAPGSATRMLTTRTGRPSMRELASRTWPAGTSAIGASAASPAISPCCAPSMR